MGCNCAGSTQNAAPTRLTRESGSQQQRPTAPAPNRREGGPGTPGFVWSGPKKKN